MALVDICRLFSKAKCILQNYSLATSSFLFFPVGLFRCSGNQKQPTPNIQKVIMDWWPFLSWSIFLSISEPLTHQPANNSDCSSAIPTWKSNIPHTSKIAFPRDSPFNPRRYQDSKRFSGKIFPLLKYEKNYFSLIQNTTYVFMSYIILQNFEKLIVKKVITRHFIV